MGTKKEISEDAQAALAAKEEATRQPCPSAEDRADEEVEWRERCARGHAILATHKLVRRDFGHVYPNADAGYVRAYYAPGDTAQRYTLWTLVPK